MRDSNSSFSAWRAEILPLYEWRKCSTLYKKFAICVDRAAPLRLERRPAGSEPLTLLESAVVTIQLRG